MHNNVLAIIFATLSALVIAWGTVVRHRIAAKAPGDGTWKGSPLFTAIRRPLWWFATSTALCGYGFQVVALSFGTLLIVQPILMLSLLFTMPMSAYLDKRAVHQDEVLWGAILTVAVTTLIVLGHPMPGFRHPHFSDWVPSSTLALVLIAVLYFVSSRQSKQVQGLLLGIIVGIIYGFIAVLSKATVDAFHFGGIVGLLHAWVFYALIAGSIIGTIVQQFAFHAGALRLSLPAMTSVEPVVAFALGHAILGESFKVHGFNWAIMALALVAMILSTFALSARGNY